MMEWIILGALSAVVYNLWRRVQKLEGYPQDVILDTTLDPTTAHDVAARIVDRHVQDFHKGGK